MVTAADPGVIQPEVNPVGLVSRTLNEALELCQKSTSTISLYTPEGVNGGMVKLMVAVWPPPTLASAWIGCLPSLPAAATTMCPGPLSAESPVSRLYEPSWPPKLSPQATTATASSPSAVAFWNT